MVEFVEPVAGIVTSDGLLASEKSVISSCICPTAKVLPLVPVMNMTTFPALAVGLAVMAIVTDARVEFVPLDEIVMFVGERVAVMSGGTGTSPNWTVPLKPLTGKMVADVTTVPPG